MYKFSQGPILYSEFGTGPAQLGFSENPFSQFEPIVIKNEEQEQRTRSVSKGKKRSQSLPKKGFSQTYIKAVENNKKTAKNVTNRILTSQPSKRKQIEWNSRTVTTGVFDKNLKKELLADTNPKRLSPSPVSRIPGKGKKVTFSIEEVEREIAKVKNTRLLEIKQNKDRELSRLQKLFEEEKQKSKETEKMFSAKMKELEKEKQINSDIQRRIMEIQGRAGSKERKQANGANNEKVKLIESVLNSVSNQNQKSGRANSRDEPSQSQRNNGLCIEEYHDSELGQISKSKYDEEILRKEPKREEIWKETLELLTDHFRGEYSADRAAENEKKKSKIHVIDEMPEGRERKKERGSQAGKGKTVKFRPIGVCTQQVAKNYKSLKADPVQQQLYTDELKRQHLLDKMMADFREAIHGEYPHPFEEIEDVKEKITNIQATMGPLVQNYVREERLKGKKGNSSIDLFKKSVGKLVSINSEKLTELLLDDLLIEIVAILQFDENKKKRGEEIERRDFMIKNLLSEIRDFSEEQQQVVKLIESNKEESQKYMSEFYMDQDYLKMARAAFETRPEKHDTQFPELYDVKVDLDKELVESVARSQIESFGHIKDKKYLQKSQVRGYQTIAELLIDEIMEEITDDLHAIEQDAVNKVLKDEFAITTVKPEVLPHLAGSDYAQKADEE